MELEEYLFSDQLSIVSRKEKTREMQEKLFEDIAKRQQKLLMASNDEQGIALLLQILEEGVIASCFYSLSISYVNSL